MEFFGTNIFVYAVSMAPEDQAKRKIARELIAAHEIALSIQVVQEFINTCSNKSRLGQSREAVLRTVEIMLSYPCAVPSAALVRRAFAIQGRYQISYYDAAILAAATELGCDTVYTEDLNHGQKYGTVKAVNPFL